MIILGELTNPEHFSGVKGFIFDCDGVMVDSLGANRYYYNLFKEHLGLPPMNADEEHYVHIHNVYESLQYIVPEELYPKAMEFRENLDYRVVIPHIDPEPGLYKIVHYLYSKKIPMAVNTNRTDTMDMLLDHLGLTRFFHPVMTTVTVTHSKPHPEGVHRILGEWGLKPRDVAFIGDSSVDEKTSMNAGTRFWAYKNEALSGELLVTGFESMLNALKRVY